MEECNQGEHDFEFIKWGEDNTLLRFNCRKCLWLEARDPIFRL
jgi:hypothetical protein